MEFPLESFLLLEPFFWFLLVILEVDQFSVSKQSLLFVFSFDQEFFCHRQQNQHKVIFHEIQFC